jgi:two-component system sensor histidine kinase BarA
MFMQIENPLTRRHRGSGIGLTYASRIVAAHGSRIEVDSRLGDGASFFFTLPCAREVDTQTGSITTSSGDLRYV